MGVNAPGSISGALPIIPGLAAGTSSPPTAAVAVLVGDPAVAGTVAFGAGMITRMLPILTAGTSSPPAATPAVPGCPIFSPMVSALQRASCWEQIDSTLIRKLGV